MRATLNRILILSISLAMFMAASLNVFAVTRETDVTAPESGNIMVTVPGSFEAADINAILKLINSYRMEACQNGYPNPDYPSEFLTPEDYVPVAWSGDLEWIAQTRAAEGAVFQSHTRPNGQSCFSCTHNGTSWGETLAWNYGSLLGGIKQWYGEKADWVNQTEGAVTGHYESLIAPGNVAVGIGCFTSKSGGWSCVAGEYSTYSGYSEAPQGIYGDCEQMMEVFASSLSTPVLSGSNSVSIGKSITFSVTQYVSYPHISGGTQETPVSVNVISWASSNTKVASIDKTGVLTAVSPGTVTVKANLADGSSISKTVKVPHPAKGSKVKKGSNIYKITKAGSEAAFSGTTSSKGKLTVPSTVTLYGKKYKVTSIAASAFKGNKKITSVIIGKNIKKIGKNAFYKCSKLKTLTIKTKSLTTKNIGSKAFTGTKIKTVKCPSGKVKKYKKILLKKGIKKAARFK